MKRSHKWSFTLCVILTLSALTLAACSGNKAIEPPSIDIWKAAAEGNTGAITQHIAAGTNINATFVQEGVIGSGGTPLHIAVLAGQENAARLLLENGANIDAKADDENGGTPLHWAVAFGTKDMVILLVEAEADINALENNGLTPLDAATVFDPEMNNLATCEKVEYLKQHGGETGGE